VIKFWLTRAKSPHNRAKYIAITANIATAAKRFYHEVLGLDVMMDLGWIATCGSPVQMTVQISVASEGGSGTAVADLSIEVDHLDAAFDATSTAGFSIEYGPVDEPWDARRFQVRDPFGNIPDHVRAP
jgi:catechol 2,3-dioxygenase-like lactoylglutathione lyase family enzyme